MLLRTVFSENPRVIALNAERCRAAKAQVRGHFWKKSATNASSRPVISGFGVRVPGGAPVLTWRYYAE
jgi:hypothetical protein